MRCSVTDLRAKEVINAKTGKRMGCVTDVEIDTCNGCVVSLTVFCGKGLCAFFGKGEETVVLWQDVVVIGDDTILVNRR